MKRNGYGECEFCGGKVVERRLTKDLRLGARLFAFENVPVGVCVNCGHRIFKGPVLERLEELAHSRAPVKRRLSVPVRDYVPA
ncbi:MAG TPA: YgiT-type zinc finger protein [Planctomycetota bacterium]|nr:YgiT-type zinc finger protein [Planctomycetota bacterium]